ncbi:SPX domain membrane protein, putative [Medicago truncatula]|uniref:SPX domain membrane protein, putative n=1 Tax=Medicago truncatula TaxID=3880 RepID=G7L0H4_MEDTR|nr:SPX domain membrane protein, putative [Medicago truncatula]
MLEEISPSPYEENIVDERYPFMSLLLNGKPIIFSAIVLLIVNMMYAMAYDLNSVVVLLMGRIFCV